MINRYLKISMEDANEGAAVPVSDKDPGADLEQKDIATPKSDSEQTGEPTGADEGVSAGTDDFTAVDQESINQGKRIHAQIERLSNAEASMEAYLDVMRGCLKNSQAFPRGAAQVMRRDLMDQYPKFFSKLGASLENISLEDEDTNDTGSTKEAVKEGEGKLAKVKGALAEGWKKFLAWLAKRWAQLRELFGKIFGRAQKAKDATTKLLASPTPQTAAEVQSDLGAVPAEAPAAEEPAAPEPEKQEAPAKAEPTKEPKGKVTVKDIGVLAGSDPYDMKKLNLRAMKDVHEKWMKPTLASLQEIVKLLVGDVNKSIQQVDMGAVAQEIIKVDFVPEQSGKLPGDRVLKPTDQRWGFKIEGEGGGESISEVDVLDQGAIKTLLATNEQTLTIALEMGKTWKQISELIAKVENEQKFFLEHGTMAKLKKDITTYLSELSNSDLQKLSAMMVKVCTVRVVLFAEMLKNQK